MRGREDMSAVPLVKVPAYTKQSQRFFNNDKGENVDFTGKTNQEPIFQEVLIDGIIGGFSFADGTKSLIYQCGFCGQLSEFNTTYNDHRETIHKAERMQFGWADGAPKWGEIDAKESDIIRGAKNE